MKMQRDPVYHLHMMKTSFEKCMGCMRGEGWITMKCSLFLSSLSKLEKARKGKGKKKGKKREKKRKGTHGFPMDMMDMVYDPINEPLDTGIFAMGEKKRAKPEKEKEEKDTYDGGGPIIGILQKNVERIEVCEIGDLTELEMLLE